jgi:N-acetylglutamate synthase-like GNAT family acetyltransferase
MGVQRRHDVDLIRNAYVLPEWQGHGIGGRLLRHLCQDADRPILIGTWAAADWAIRFYERHGFARVSDDDIAPLLRTYWNVPDRQIATSVVLTSRPLGGVAAADR